MTTPTSSKQDIQPQQSKQQRKQSNKLNKSDIEEIHPNKTYKNRTLISEEYTEEQKQLLKELEEAEEDEINFPKSNTGTEEVALNMREQSQEKDKISTTKNKITQRKQSTKESGKASQSTKNRIKTKEHNDNKEESNNREIKRKGETKAQQGSIEQEEDSIISANKKKRKNQQGQARNKQGTEIFNEDLSEEESYKDGHSNQCKGRLYRSYKKMKES